MCVSYICVCMWKREREKLRPESQNYLHLPQKIYVDNKKVTGLDHAVL